VVQDDLGDERSRLKVSTPLAFEQVAFGADHGAALEHCGQIRHMALLVAEAETCAMTTWQEKVPGIVPPNGRTAAWAAANPRSGSLAQRARRTLPGGVTHDVRRAAPFPLAVARAEGAHKWDLDGHEIICYVMGHGALLLGHSDPAVVAAVRHQATLAFHPGACHELECEWAELVVDLVPSAELVRFTASGTEASLLALRLARAATGRPRVVKLAGHFHGWHDQVSFGTDPPFRGPDTAGVPDVLGPAGHRGAGRCAGGGGCAGRQATSRPSSSSRPARRGVPCRSPRGCSPRCGS
jgi:hypothetical protein